MKGHARAHGRSYTLSGGGRRAKGCTSQGRQLGRLLARNLSATDWAVPRPPNQVCTAHSAVAFIVPIIPDVAINLIATVAPLLSMHLSCCLTKRQ